MTAPVTAGRTPPDGVEPRVRALAAAHLALDPARLVPGALLGEDLGVDSLAAIELGMALEDEFDISLPDDVIGDVRSYEDMVDVVRRRVGNHSTARL